MMNKTFSTTSTSTETGPSTSAVQQQQELTVSDKFAASATESNRSSELAVRLVATQQPSSIYKSLFPSASAPYNLLAGQRLALNL